MAKSKTPNYRLWPALFFTAVAALLFALTATDARSEEAGSAVFQRANYDLMGEQMLTPTVQIGQLAGNQQTRFCSGSVFWSDRDEESGSVSTLILTAKHCVKRVGDPMDVIVPRIGDGLELVGEDTYRAVADGVCGNADLAYLRLEDTDHLLPVAALAGAETELFEIEPVWVVGYPKGLSRHVTQGQLGYLSAQPDYMGSSSFFDLLTSTASATGGNSGGPVFHQSTNGSFEQIGVLVAGFPNSQWMTSMVGLEAMNGCVDGFLEREGRRLDRMRQSHD